MAKHPPEPWWQSIRQNYDHRSGEASAGGAIILTAAKASEWEGAFATTWRQSIRQKRQPSTRQSIHGWGQHALSSNICMRGGLRDIGGKASARATTAATPTTYMTNQSEEQHEAQSGTTQRSNGGLATSQRRFFNDAFRKGEGSRWRTREG
jgi:hypothetical protein